MNTEPRKTWRQAMMYVSRPLLLPLLPAGRGVLDLEGIADLTGQRFAWLAEALHLPSGTRITGVSTVLRLVYDEVALRIEHPDFIETMEGCACPEVQAMYGWDNVGKVTFAYWLGPAVGLPLDVCGIAGPRFPPPERKPPPASTENVRIGGIMAKWVGENDAPPPSIHVDFGAGGKKAPADAFVDLPDWAKINPPPDRKINFREFL